MRDRMEQIKESTEIRISYGTQTEASSAYPWVEGVITCFYLYNEEHSLDSDEASHGDPFQLFILNYNECIRDYDKSLFLERYPDCVFRYLRQDGSDIVMEQCSGLQGRVPDMQSQSREGFFNCLCFILTMILPLKPFKATCCYKNDESDFVQVTRAEYDTIDIHFEQYQGEQGDRVTADWILAPECISKK